MTHNACTCGISGPGSKKCQGQDTHEDQARVSDVDGCCVAAQWSAHAQTYTKAESITYSDNSTAWEKNKEQGHAQFPTAFVESSCLNGFNRVSVCRAKPGVFQRGIRV